MPAPITHIVLTEKIFDNFFSDKDKKEFYQGTCFPDIRYLGVIGRDTTHLPQVSLKDIQGKSSFLAGMEFHSLIDKVSVDFFLEQNIYQRVFTSPEFKSIHSQALKLLVDRMLYNKINNWPEIISYLDSFSVDALSFGVSEESIKKWHQALRVYFSKRPGDGEVGKMVTLGGAPPETVQETIELINKLKENDLVVQVVNDLYNNFNSLLKNH